MCFIKEHKSTLASLVEFYLVVLIAFFKEFVGNIKCVGREVLRRSRHSRPIHYC